jgi:stearoyl-CoA desaturase (delta-9 desaturase)
LKTDTAIPGADEKINWLTSIPFIGVHLMCLFVLQVGARPVDVAVCVGLYLLRMWGITAGFHRYFSHRAYKTNRVFQFILAFVGTSAAQKGVLWWAAHHRHHHRYSDQQEDIHSPVQKGFWWSHTGWILCDKYGATKYEAIKDFARYPELVWLNRFHLVPPVLLAVALFFIGGFSMLVWGFFVSTTRSATSSASAATRRRTPAATTGCWRSSPWARAGTTTTTTTRTPPTRAGSGGRWT